MAYYYPDPSHTFSEYLLVPGYTSEECVPDRVSLKTPLVKYRKGQEDCPISLNIPMVSAIMQSVSNDTLAVALAKEGGLSFICGSQSIESEAEMVRRVKSSKAGFVVSASNLTPEHTLADVLALKEKNGFSTVAITEDAMPNGKLLGIVTSRDYRVSRMSTDLKVRDFMTPREKLITAPSSTTLKEANDIIWEHKLNALPIVDENDCLRYFVFRKDYAEHKEHPLALQDAQKRYLVGAGINSRDYHERAHVASAFGSGAQGGGEALAHFVVTENETRQEDPFLGLADGLEHDRIGGFAVVQHGEVVAFEHTAAGDAGAGIDEVVPCVRDFVLVDEPFRFFRQ